MHNLTVRKTVHAPENCFVVIVVILFCFFLQDWNSTFVFGHIPGLLPIRHKSVQISTFEATFWRQYLCKNKKKIIA